MEPRPKRMLPSSLREVRTPGKKSVGDAEGLEFEPRAGLSHVPESGTWGTRSCGAVDEAVIRGGDHAYWLAGAARRQSHMRLR